MGLKVVIVGGVAGGATAAARVRRLDEQAEIVVLERGEHVSFANCGLPYHIGGEIPTRASLLVQTRAGLAGRFALDIRTRHEVIAVDRATRRVRVRELETGREYDESYDRLVLSPGAEPVRPPLPGVDLPRVCTLRNLADTDRVKTLVDDGAQAAIIVGGGFIGLEMAENLRRRGLAVTLVEMLPQVMPPLDVEMAAPLHAELVRSGVELLLGETVAALAPATTGEGVQVTLKSGRTCAADFIVLSVGVRPETGLARAAGLELNERGAIVVDEHMRTSDPHVYAVGDAVQVRDFVLNVPTMLALAGPANRQARVAADHICGRSSRFRGVQGTGIVRVFELVAAMTGASERTLKRAGTEYRKVYVSPPSHAGYFPGAQPLTIKLLFRPDGRLLGGQIVGGEGVDKRIDVLALALQAGLNVADLAEAELAYAPPFSSAKDPLNVAGLVACNLLSGDVEFVYPEELDEASRAAWTIVDVRNEPEVASVQIPGALWIPLPELRARWREIPTNKPVAVVCASAQRSYYAYRFLRQQGLKCRNIAGGMRVYGYVHAGKRAGADASCKCG